MLPIVSISFISKPQRMFFKTKFFRLLAIPACLVWGVRELLCLQRARLDWRR